ncbi:uncharacterized protein LOC128735856 [Sabethes cyaneus]|uniref:uncharacterized protein LOC128735856 n=1 Tax=Sabethes cyaneus TaxID=53552 RepID=UPI00237DCE47|nr:uncharacterized protein LOC128735856 [Sabethes cyaneus]
MAPTTTGSGKKNPSLKTLQTKLKTYLNMFKDIRKFVQAFSVETTANQVTVRLEKLEDLWEKVNDVILEIEIHEDYTAEDESYIQQRSEFGNDYYEVKSLLLDKIKQFDEQPSMNASVRVLDTTQQPTIEHVRLPQIKLQTFDGNIDEWLSFRDLYTSLIHWKADLPDVEKFHYLKGCLAGEAKALIDPLSITRANYQIAWDTLTRRYNDSKVLKRRQVQALFKLPSLSKESATELQTLLEGFERVVQTLDQLIQPADYKDLLLLDILSTRLDGGTRRAWEEYSSTRERDTVKDLCEFLQRRVHVLGVLPAKPTEPKAESSRQFRRTQNPTRYSHNVVQNAVGKCVACSESHLLYQCPAFRRLSVPARDKMVRTHSLCINCFKRGHRATECPSKYSCGMCKERHNTLVCFKSENNKAAREKPKDTTGSREASAQVASASTTPVSSNVSGYRASSVLLATAVVLVEDDEGRSIPARALLDSGSECNFMTEGLGQRIKIKRQRSDVSVFGIGETSTRVKQMTTTTIRSRVSGFSRRMEFLLLPRVTANLPITNVNMAGWEIPSGIELADPAFFTSKAVDLVLGIQHFFAFFNTGNEVQLGEGLPTLTESVFGWVVSGSVDGPQRGQRISCNMAVGLEELLGRFWSCEEIGSPTNYSPEELRCEEQFAQTVQRGSDGRYTVSLPKVEGAFGRIGDSRDIAFRRLQGIERRLSRDAELRNQYNQFMEEYRQLGHMRRVDVPCKEQVVRCYLPHHPVIKQESTTTKVRVVFDASCKTATGESLNDILLAGPVIQDDLRSIILRSRTKQILLVSDVEKMFRQIQIAEADRPLQSILWRTDTGEDAETYELTTVTYGTKPAPFLATRTLKQLAMDEQALFPLAARAASEDVYMDDILTGIDDAEAALEMRVQLMEMLRKGGFRLRKWASNCPTVLQGIPEEDLAVIKADGYELDSDPAVKTLGLIWHPNRDVLKFRFKIPELSQDERLSKRKVLSIIATLFDPLGLIGTVITTAKVFMQLLWCLKDEDGKKLDWDHWLPASVEREWRNFHAQLPFLNELVIRRCVILPRAISVELHLFSDASERAYGACAYVRSVDSEGTVSVVLLTSKSKVAPLQCQSIPRLELCGARMAAELSSQVIKAIKMQIEVVFWTDSTCVLRWIKAAPSTWTTFVANRVAKIQTLTENKTWRYVPGTENPADLISRGINPEQIQTNILWWEGPTWLKAEKELWPKDITEPIAEEAAKEARRTAVHCISQQEEFGDWYVRKFSSFSTMIRTTAWWFRLMDHLKGEGLAKRNSGFLKTTELKLAEQAIIRRVQREVFNGEWKALSSDSIVARSSPLRWFNPQISGERLIRVGGRLANAMNSEEAKHPLVLPARHPFTKLLLEHYHRKLLHAGPQLLISAVRLKYWPLGGRAVARQPVQQLMGELPTVRVTAARPFSRTGVDYFGPIYVRPGPRRTAVKGYVAVFICMCTKAVHLELVTDLSTECFLKALRRFIARRGICSDIFSDNGTNFVGARNQLKALFELLRSKEHQEGVTRECARDGIQWHFNPPSAPHFGGLWEAAVKSAKFHLLRVLGDHIASIEDMCTLLAQVEGCLNSRPLTAMSDDPHDLQPLTPGHFLTGASLQQLPESDYSAIPMNRLKHWQVIQKKLQEFWKRWQSEYLAQLQGRTKRWRPPVPITEGQLVVIRDENLPPIKWKMGRIQQVHPGDDGVVRVVTLKTAAGLLKRPVEKICILPLSSIEDNSQ